MTETKVCVQCRGNFKLEDEDFDFYKKMGVNAPEFCGACGIQQAMIWRNEHTLYRGKCTKCGKSTFSMYHPNSPYVTWCHDCWWKDDWDGASYALDYDPSRPLLEQYYELRKKVPRESVIILNSANCDFTNHVRYSKDCYMVDLATYSESAYYSEWIVKGKDVMDCKKMNVGELLIECVDTSNCSRSVYLQDCSDSAECFFAYDLKGCTNCIFSSNLRNKSYYAFNKQVSKEEFEKIKKETLNGSWQDLQKHLAKFNEIKTQALHKYSQVLNSSNVTGGYIEDCNRLTYCFDAMECQDVKSSASIGMSKSGQYSYSIGWPAAEFFFGDSVMRGGNNVKFSFLATTSNNCAYVDSVVSCTECIASIGLKHKEFSILNKAYLKEEYFKIKTELEKKGELSVFPGQEFSTFAYNESAAQTQYPLAKEESLRQGFKWQDEIPPTTGQETMKPEKMPDNLKDASNEILKEIFKCTNCSRNFRIIQRELDYYRQFNLPLPRECPQCRMLRRREQRTPYKLWPGACRCSIEQHSHGGTGCKNTFMTPYAPSSLEKVFCESCYNAEIA